MASTNLPKWLQVIAALNAQPDKIVWHAECADCSDLHANFALWDAGLGQTLGNPTAITWHDCSGLAQCCSCHEANSNKECAYFGSELHESEAAENLAYDWYAR